MGWSRGGEVFLLPHCRSQFAESRGISKSLRLPRRLQKSIPSSLFFPFFFFLFILFSFSFSTFFFIPLTSRRRTKFIFSAFFSDLSLQIRNRVESTTLHRSLYRTIAGTNVIKAGRRTGPIRLLVRVFTLSLFHIGSLCVFICIVTNMSK